MNSEKIKEIQLAYRKFGNHETVQNMFNLSAAQEYAINIYGRDNHLTNNYLAMRMDKIKSGMSIGEIQDILR